MGVVPIVLSVGAGVGGKKCYEKYRTVILPVVFCGHATWFFSLREGDRPRLENRVLRKKNVLTRSDVTVC